ncbi:Cytochrome c oxidase subunit 6C [Trachymyrmex septentrionalis]|uniref:Cytochrome c oxidase subunit 6C n=1 Tax=Trachymyrmex septentrionalis TaxID=34720 RepID=A0A195EVT4_9HYME|nr:PREDICTED: cytochrome c oxidase subunit 6C [Trachymyrmex septentrionalis]XP_018353016.1 PREDICTED: cytochrome c oxidase subunit 6C [Trachymyrmex septentrionalis]KYN32004.1 Cytochrome c oxidase subunit 6C [Trachymyrmex septentrionalis]
MSTPIVKPQLRHLLTAQIKKNLVTMMVVSISAGVAYKILVVDKRKQRYADFYRTYDAEKQLKIMNEAGLMQSYKPSKK